MSEPIKETDFDDTESTVEETHQFTAEKPKKGPSRYKAMAVLFLVILIALLLTIWFGKNKLAEWRAERDAAQAQKEAAAAQGANQRRGRTFDVDDYVPPPREEKKPEPTNLPQNFNEPAPSAKAIPLQSGQPGTSSAARPGQAPARERPPMMLSGGDNNRPSTVQEQARLTAHKTMPSKTQQASAAELGDRSFVITRGSYIPCILQTQLFSNVPGQSGCEVPEDIYSNDGTHLLIPRGSKVVGQYGQTMQNGDSRIAVVWERIETTKGYVIDVDSGAADGVGTMGVGGFVDNHWPERIGAALLLSLIDDAVDIAIANQQSNDSGTSYGSSTSRGTKTIAEKVLDSTINIKPTLERNRGARLMIYVSKDLWFDEVEGG